MKKIIVGIFSFVLLFVAQNAFAATWNGASNDCRGISIVNATTNEGYAHPCWPSSSVSADAGDTLNVRIYYHNTGTATANNTTVTLNAPIGGSASSSKSFSGNISSDQGSLSLSTVTANLSSSQTITFNSVKWYTNNTSETLTALPGGQSGAEILSGGLNLGSIAPGWATQGSLVVSFHVSNTTAPQLCQDTSATNYLGALPCTYPQLCKDTSATNYNGTLPCTYPQQLCRDVSASNYLGALPCTYPQLCKDTSASNYGKVLPCTYPPQLCQDTSASNYLGALPCTYPQLCKDTSASNYGKVLPCTYPPQLCKDTSASNYNQPIPCTYPPQLCQDTSASNYRGVLPCTYPSRICEDHTASNYGGALPCTYPPQLCKDTSASNYNGALPCTYPPQLCRDVSANNYLGALPCTYPIQSVCSITSFSASDTSISNGDPVTLRWNTDNCDHVKLSNFSGNVSLDGNKTVYPTEDTTYILNAYNSDGSHETDSVKVYVDNNNNNNNNNSNCSIDSFTASNTYINQGDPVTLRWYTSGCSNISISNIGNVYSSGSQIVYPTNTTNYILTAYGSNSGTQTRSVLVTVNSYVAPIVYNNPVYNNPVAPVYNTCAVTTVATSVNQTGAQLNGIVTSPAGANTYFEYGPTVGLGYRTNSRYINGNTNFSEMVSTLSPNTIYYFRMNSDCQNGTSLGSIAVFRTLAIPQATTQTVNVVTAKPIIIQGTTITGSASPIVLQIENRYQTIGIGDIIDYTVYYKNISSSTLTHPMVQVFIPQGITLMNSSRGTYRESDKTLSVPIEDLVPNAEGVIYLQARVDTMDVNLAQIVTTAILVYTNPNGAQENAMAYVLNNPRLINTNLLGASAFFGNIFGLGLIGWLILIILILLLILIARSLYNQKRRNVMTTTTQKTISQ